MSAAAPDVSVVIPTFRREQLLLESIASALGQEGAIEVIVVDDSPEGAARAAAAGVGDSRVRYLKSDPPSGGKVGLARNQGAAVARGRFLLFLDDDDLLAGGALAALAAALAGSGAGLAFGRAVPFGDKPALIAKLGAYYARAALAARRIRGRRWFAAQMLFGEWPLVNSGCMYRASAFAAAGGFGAAPFCEDIDLALRVGRASGARFVDRDVIHHRVGHPSLTSAQIGLDDVPYIREAYLRLQGWYRARYGVADFGALKAAAKLLRLLRLLR